MRVGLHLSILDSAEDYSVGRRFRFAVVDLDKAKDYPLNFVCMLPMQLSLKGNGGNVFAKVFGDKSLGVAKELLLGALETESDSEVKAEIERRLKLLAPKPVVQIECSGCGKPFQPKRIKRFRNNFCSECMEKKFGSRT